MKPKIKEIWLVSFPFSDLAGKPKRIQLAHFNISKKLIKLLPIACCLLPVAYCLPSAVNLDVSELKTYMARVEGENSRLRHYLARLHRKTFCYSKSKSSRKDAMPNFLMLRNIN